jgi:hypothetical protein
MDLIDQASWLSHNSVRVIFWIRLHIWAITFTRHSLAHGHSQDPHEKVPPTAHHAEGRHWYGCMHVYTQMCEKNRSRIDMAQLKRRLLCGNNKMISELCTHAQQRACRVGYVRTVNWHGTTVNGPATAVGNGYEGRLTKPRAQKSSFEPKPDHCTTKHTPCVTLQSTWI